jgi:hypothetical protein
MTADPKMTLSLLLCFAVTAFLTGLIWFVQIVHYPIFMKVSPENFIDFQTAHMQATGSVVILPMLAELLLSGILLAMQWEENYLNRLNYTAFGLVLLIWAATGLLSVPVHNQLVANGFNEKLIRQLVATNWLRTLAWTARTGILGFLVWQKMGF